MAADDRLKQGAWTPYRQTRVTLDVPEVFLLERPTQLRYPGSQIPPDQAHTAGVEQLSSGVWILKPANDSLDQAAMTADWGTLRLADWEHADNLEEIAFYRKRVELTGVLWLPDVQDVADYWIRKRVGAGSSWNSTIPANLPQVAEFEFSPASEMDRVMSFYGDAAYSLSRENGFLVRWILYGRATEHPDTIFQFYFGGDVDDRHHGRFCLQVTGSGTARLFEFSETDWVFRESWQYCDPSTAGFGEHAMRILPHAGVYIEFRHQMKGRWFEAMNLLTTQKLATVRSDTHLHRVVEFPAYPSSAGLLGRTAGECRDATGKSDVALDIRRDLRLDIQINSLIYPVSPDLTTATSTGTLRSAPIDFGENLITTHVVEILPDGKEWLTLDESAYAARINLRLYNAATGLVCATDTESVTEPVSGEARSVEGWVLPTPRALVQVDVKFNTLVKTVTPQFWGYTLVRNGEMGTSAGTSEQHLGTRNIREVSITSDDAEMDHATANISIRDRMGEVQALRKHGSVSIQVETRFDPTDDTRWCTLFDGYVERAPATKRGTKRLPFRGGTTSAYRNWVDYDCDCHGKWQRLFEQRIQTFCDFSDSRSPLCPEGPTGVFDRQGNALPWRFIHMIGHLLYWFTGTPKTQMALGESRMRPYFTKGADKNQTILLTPFVTVGEVIRDWCRNYLGAALIWDANAGPSQCGMWRLVEAPYGSECVQWNFVTEPASGAVPHRLESYPERTSPIKSGTYVTYPVKPEFNDLLVYSVLDKDGVSTRDDKWVRNEKSFDFNPLLPSADPDDLDYLGRRIEMRFAETLAPDMVPVVQRRLANAAMRGYRMVTFTSHLVLLDPLIRDNVGSPSDDPMYDADVLRPPILGDLVTIDSGTDLYMVRSCNPAYRRDRMQLANYELQLLRTPPKW